MVDSFDQQGTNPKGVCETKSCVGILIDSYRSGQITIIPKPELRGFWGDSLTKPPFGVASARSLYSCSED